MAVSGDDDDGRSGDVKSKDHDGDNPEVSEGSRRAKEEEEKKDGGDDETRRRRRKEDEQDGRDREKSSRSRRGRDGDRDRDRDRSRSDRGGRDRDRDEDGKRRREDRDGRGRGGDEDDDGKDRGRNGRDRGRDRGDGKDEDDNERNKSSRDRRKRRDEKGDDGDNDSDSGGSSSSSSSSRDRRRRRKRSRGGRGSSSRDRRGRRRSRRKESSRRRERGRKRRGERKRRRRSSSSSSSSSSGSSSSSSSSNSSSSSEDDDRRSKKTRRPPAPPPSERKPNKKVVNERLLRKLAERGETLEEREERRSRRRAARIEERFGYTADVNPFNDPNLHETFSWKKREEKKAAAAAPPAGGLYDGVAGGVGVGGDSRKHRQEKIFEEIDKVRKRRHDRELHFEEVERQRAEESRQREQENFDEWARKEEQFHLAQQRQRSAIRLVEGRERPVDVLAKNLLLFGLTEEEKRDRAKVKYQEKYNALDELETLEAELEEPHLFLRDLKLAELEELLADVDTFRMLEREAAVAASREDGGAAQRQADDGENPVLRYWDALHLVTKDEIEYVRTGGAGGAHASVVEDVHKMFEGQSAPALHKMKGEVEAKLGRGRSAAGGAAGPAFDDGGVVDTDYWQMVLDQLNVHLAKLDLSELHSKMLVRQLEKLEKRKEDLARAADAGGGTGAGGAGEGGGGAAEDGDAGPDEQAAQAAVAPRGVEPNFGNLEEELGLSTEVDLGSAPYAWQDRYRPRKPRYFNRVKTGYDWNKYNQTHYDHDNPPPKTVQGYKFNIFYPDLIDKTRTPQYILEPADTKDFCIIRFRAGPPYEDIAFKIINREWNRSRKRGFRCTFERGVLSLYFNFASHWYRR